MSDNENMDIPFTGMVFNTRENSNWGLTCGGITYVPEKGKEPNWFHRKMQELAFGFKWRKI